MKAAYLSKHGKPADLALGEVPRPQARRGEALVKVQATAITATEFDWFPTFMTQSGAPRPFPIILGHEFSGVVAEVGAGAGAWRAGDAVYGMNDWFADGAQAEFCAASVGSLAARSGGLDATAAAAVPISALTAWQGLFDRCQLKSGERVLIHGGAGGVGVFAVQLARWRGAQVVATASARNLDFVRQLGAAEVIDYKGTRFEDVVQGVDVLFDVVGGETLERSWGVLSPEGRAVTVAAQSATATDPRVRGAFFIVEPRGDQLVEISKLLEAGTLRPVIGGVFPLAEVHAAYAQAQGGGVRGKIVLELPAMPGREP